MCEGEGGHATHVGEGTTTHVKQSYSSHCEQKLYEQTVHMSAHVSRQVQQVCTCGKA
jgi:hypothetical protein